MSSLDWIAIGLYAAGMIGVAMLVLPFFCHLGLISIYEYLEHRFDASVRYLLSGVFLISRALRTAVGLYASAIVLQVTLGLSLRATILAMGGITIVYDTIGGIKAVVYSDAIQSFILLAWIFLAIGYGLYHISGIEAAMTSLSPERWQALDPTQRIGDGSNTPFWGFLVGGLFLHVLLWRRPESGPVRAERREHRRDPVLAVPQSLPPCRAWTPR